MDNPIRLDVLELRKSGEHRLELRCMPAARVQDAGADAADADVEISVDQPFDLGDIRGCCRRLKLDDDPAGGCVAPAHAVGTTCGRRLAVQRHDRGETRDGERDSQ